MSAATKIWPFTSVAVMPLFARVARRLGKLRGGWWYTDARPEPEWLDDDDPLARIINAAWESGEPIYWQDGDPLPERVEKPRKVERNDL